MILSSRLQADACELCQALDGTNCATLPHPSCLCQIVPPKKRCTHTTDLRVYQYGSGNKMFKLAGELTITCPDGSEISMSVEIDASGLTPSLDSEGHDYSLEEALDAQYDELCEQCPEAEEPGVA